MSAKAVAPNGHSVVRRGQSLVIGWRIARVVFGEIPEMCTGVLIWWALLQWGAAFIATTPILLQITIVVAVVLALVGSIRLAIREKARIRKSILTSAVDAIMAPVEAKQDLISSLLFTLPTQQEVRTMMTLAEDHAASWAPDGHLTEASLFVDASACEASISLQVVLISNKRKETTFLHLPSVIFGKISPVKESIPDCIPKTGFFYAPPRWREATIRAIEGMSVELRKATLVRLMLILHVGGSKPESQDLHIIFNLEHGSMEWTLTWQFEGGQLLNHEGSAVADFAA